MCLPSVLGGIRLSDTVLTVRHPLRSKELQSSLLQILLGDAWKSSAFESRSFSMLVWDIVIVLMAARATLKETKTAYHPCLRKRGEGPGLE